MNIYKVDYTCLGRTGSGYALAENESHAKRVAEENLDGRICKVIKVTLASGESESWRPRFNYS